MTRRKIGGGGGGILPPPTPHPSKDWDADVIRTITVE